MEKKRFFLLIFALFFLFQVVSARMEYNLTYDLAGNLVQGFGEYHEYDNFNQLKAIRKGNITGSLITEFFYDHEGKRVKKIEYGNVTNTTTYYIGENFIQVVNKTGKFNTTYYYQDGTLVARKDNNGKKFYYHPDHLGSTSLVTNESGAIAEEEFYFPYGESLEGSEESKFLFTGKEKDKSVGLYYYGARYYDPFTKIFIQPDNRIQDLYNPQDLNKYSYARNNPYKYNDPSGNLANVATGLAGAGIGAGLSGAISIGSQLYSTGQVSWSDVAKSTIAGGVAGGVAGLTFGLGAIALGGAELSTGAFIGLGATSGVTSGISYRGTSNALYGQPITQNVFDPNAIVRDAAIGGVTAGAVKGASGIGKKVGFNSAKISSQYAKQVQLTESQLKEKLPQFEFGTHSINRILQKTDVDSVVDAYKTGKQFYDPKYGNIVFSKNKVNLHIDPANNKVKTVTTGNPSSRFRSLDGESSL